MLQCGLPHGQAFSSFAQPSSAGAPEVGGLLQELEQQLGVHWLQLVPHQQGLQDTLLQQEGLPLGCVGVAGGGSV
jgi:hypothetical protein